MGCRGVGVRGALVGQPNRKVAPRSEIGGLNLGRQRDEGALEHVSITEDGRREDELIREPRRFGEFASPDWIRRFLAARLQLDPA
jgi:hypothetical protein